MSFRIYLRWGCRDGGFQLLRDVDPVSGSGHHGLGIDGSKSKMVAEFETSSIGGQVIHSQNVRVRGVDYQILDIPPRQIWTAQMDKNIKLLSRSIYKVKWGSLLLSEVSRQSKGK